MNANELADALQETEPYYSTDYKLFDKAATMLRLQADYIAQLEKGLESSIAMNKDWDWQIDFARAILRKAQEK